MKASLVRPCKHCPFRVDIPGYLRRSRAQEIADSLFAGDVFTCHETNSFDEDGMPSATPTSQVCAGALLMMRHENLWEPSALQVFHRLKLLTYDPNRLDLDAPVAKSRAEFVEHHDA